MPTVAQMVTSLGGMAQKQQLVSLGARDVDLTAAVRHGEVRRARQGWYTVWAENDLRVRAVRVGGRLSGISAVAAAGGWVLGSFALHVSVHDNAARLRTPWNRFLPLSGRAVDGLVLHWDDSGIASRGTGYSVDIRDALLRVVLDEQLETAVAALDWALHTGRIDRIDFYEIISELPPERQWIMRWVDELSDSLPESLSRVRLRLAGFHVVSQHPLGDLEHIDLVIEGCVGFETDGEEFHLQRFEADRAKDLDIAAAHLHNIRASARQVFYEWPRVLRAITTAVDDRRARALPVGNSGEQPPHPLDTKHEPSDSADAAAPAGPES